MNKRLISRLMQERVSGLLNSGVYFFRDDFDLVLRGVVLEYTPRGLYIWDFRFPLFDFFGPNLNYSDRLPEGAFIGKEEMSEVAIVDYVMTTQAARDAFFADAPTSLADFVEYLRTSDALLNPHSQLIYAATLALLGQESQAAGILDEIFPVTHANDLVHWKRLRDDIGRGPGIAHRYLDEIRERNLRILRVR